MIQKGKELIYTTEDLYFAAFLFAQDVLEFTAVRVVRPGKAVFEFKDRTGIADEIKYHFESGVEISAAALFAALRYIKKQMFNALDTQDILTNGF